MKQAGFTLVELLVVVIIMGILTAIAMPQYRKAMDRSKAAEAMQMLPALFEARERWVIEKQCTWSNGAITSCNDNVTLTPKKLDIESKGTINNDEGTITTPTFKYTLVDSKPTNKHQACISAKPQWGESRGLTGATIYYRGDKFSCTDANQGAACDILNVADDSHRTGCI